jgi:hypothetical protein
VGHVRNAVYCGVENLDLPAQLSEWMSALKDAAISRIPEIRNNARAYLEAPEIGEVERIQLAQECKSPDIMLHGYKRLVTRDLFAAEDGERLGKDATVKLFRLRDKYLLSRLGSFPHGPFELTAEIEKVFGPEMDWAYFSDGGSKSEPEPLATDVASPHIM